MKTRIDLFQYAFISKEIVPFIESTKRWALQLQRIDEKFDHMKNCLFSHVFVIDFQQLQRFSHDLADLFITDIRVFKDILIKIIFRLVKRIVASQVGKDTIKLDIQQLRIRIEPRNLPVESVIPDKNGLISLHSHKILHGTIVRIDNTQPLIIRYFYQCRNSDCNFVFYLKPKEKFGSVHCRRCGELAQEDLSGRISIPVKHIHILPEGGLGLSPIDVVLKGSICDIQVSIGQKVGVVGVISFQTERKFCLHTNRIFRFTKKADSNAIQPELQALIDELDSFSPNGHKPLKRVLLLSAISCIMEKSLLIVVRSVSNMEYVLQVLQTAFGNLLTTFFPSKQLTSGRQDFPNFLACENGIALIPHINVLSGTGLERFTRVISEKSVGGYRLHCGMIAILVSPGLEPVNNTPFECFDLMVRVNHLPEALMEDWLFGQSITGNPSAVKTRINTGLSVRDSVTVGDEAEDLMNRYNSMYKREMEDYISTDIVLELAQAVAAFRRSEEVTGFDMFMAIYFFEEKQAAWFGIDGIMSQLPTEHCFFTQSVSAIPITDESALFECWINLVKKEISR